nr:immunoglobulin light chain junction region [Macaca mulatta]MOW65714.1 immunoglobulin light chain junction region [Macaca mulatta]
CQKYSDSPSSF